MDEEDGDEVYLLLGPRNVKRKICTSARGPLQNGDRFLFPLHAGGNQEGALAFLMQP
jgi:hypothetical protein